MNKRLRFWRQLWHRHRHRIIPGAKIALLYGLFWYACWNILDPDFGWHLKAGDVIRQHWIPLFDPYTYTAASFPWINHEWGHDVVVSYLYQWGGFGLLAVVFAGLWTAAICLFRTKIRLAILLAALLALLPYTTVRPAVWTVLGLAILLELVGRQTKLALRAIPLLFVVWVNLHGGFIIGLAVLGYMGLRYWQRRWWLLLAACLVATCVNPYGLRIYIEVARTVFDSGLHQQITEWRPLHVVPKAWPIIVIWAMGFWLFARRTWQNWLGLAPLLLLASLSATRNIPLFTIVALRDLDSYARQFAALPAWYSRAARLAAGAFSCLVVVALVVPMASAAQTASSREAPYPRQPVAYLQQHPCPGNVFNNYNFGGYLIWKVPSAAIYIDGRMPTWSDSAGQSYIEQYNRAMREPAVLRAEVARYDIRCALLATGDTQAIQTLRSDGWRTAAQDKIAVLLVRPM